MNSTTSSSFLGLFLFMYGKFNEIYVIYPAQRFDINGIKKIYFSSFFFSFDKSILKDLILRKHGIAFSLFSFFIIVIFLFFSLHYSSMLSSFLHILRLRRKFGEISRYLRVKMFACHACHFFGSMLTKLL